MSIHPLSSLGLTLIRDKTKANFLFFNFTLEKDFIFPEVRPQQKNVAYKKEFSSSH